MIKLVHPFKMYGEFQDGFRVTVGGYDEEDCIEKLADLQGKHGALEFYTGVNNEDYVDGAYVGRENISYC